MSTINCDSCENLRNIGGDFPVNGVTPTVAASLANNTGFNPSLTVAHTDCEDLNDANDCLVGRMDQELEAYEMCDWKDYMHKFIPNVYEVIKAVIAALCGVWTRMDDLIESVKNLCTMVDAILSPPLMQVSNYPLGGATSYGTIAQKNGSPLLVPVANSELPTREQNAQHFGIKFAKQKVKKCASGACESLEWIGPSCFAMKTTDDVEIGDILWYCDKTTFMARTGMSEALWEAFTISSRTWRQFALGTSHKYVWLQITIDENEMGPNYITIVCRGTSYPNGKPGNERVTEENGDYVQLYRIPC